MRRRFGRNDWIFIGSLTVVCLGIILLFQLFFHEPGSIVVVTRDGEIYGTYRLSENQTINITDADGNVTNVLMIADGKAYMSEADCPDKLCLYQNAISAENENIVCLPNRIVVTVTASDDEGMDGFVQ